ncbi:MAG: hypothetical protein N3B12_08155, partial [Armatimonadetes bacterium]|nr:hypothetical protein [Armatimonadota bacterium]
QRRQAAEEADYKLVRLNSKVWKSPPEWVILSDYETADARRLEKNRSSIASRDRQEVNRILGILSRVEAKYVVRNSFGGNPLGFMKGGLLPHDMR